MTKPMMRIAIFLCATAFTVLPVPAAERDLPIECDWRDVAGVDYVSPVRNMSLCGAPYIFAPVAMVEARFRIAVVGMGGALPDVDYSEQFIMDCGSGWFGDFGCNGGYSRDVLDHIRDNGVPLEECYNYAASEGECPTDCPDSSDDLVFRWPVADSGELGPLPSDEVVMQEILDNGPVAATMELYEDLYTFPGGVYEHTSGSWIGSTVMLIVGWDEPCGVPCWICRGFWGEGWGDGGDILIARNAGHAGCDFGETVWTCTIDASWVDNETMSMGEVKNLYR